MLVSKYSSPDFNPYGDESSDEPDVAWQAPTARGPVDAVVSLPGSKSQTARELVLSALADGPSLLKAPLHSRDSTAMVAALRGLGVRIDEQAGRSATPDLLVTPAEELLGSTTIDCGQAGTVMRFVPTLAALALGPVVFDADATARSRPMAPLLAALRQLGADINDDGRGRMPFTVHGMGRLAGGAATVDASDSSQFVSGLLLAGPRLVEGLQLRHEGARLPSLPHIEMTVAALTARGVAVSSPSATEWNITPGSIGAATVDIEPDLSNAAPFLAAALVAGGSVTVPGWPSQTTQVGNELIGLLPRFGARVTRDGDRLTVSSADGIHGADLDLTTGGELAPTLVVLAALADSPSEITGIGHIRHHETDRLAALATELNRLGGHVTELDDGLRIEPRALTGGLWHSYHDHRMATAGALVGLAVEGVEIENVQATAKTLPAFTTLWQRMLSAGPPKSTIVA